MKSLIIAEHNNLELNQNTLNVISAAREITDDISLVVAGFNCDSVITGAKKIPGVTKVLTVDDEVYKGFSAESIAELVHSIADEFSYILAPATTFGKNILPRLSAMLDVQQISDIIKVVSADTFMRPIYAGNAIETVQSSDKKKLITVRTTAFSAIEQGETENKVVALKPINKSFEGYNFIKLDEMKTERPDLSVARVVVSGGRGLQNEENFKLIEKLADKLGAAIGASRAAVDAGFIPNDHQVGQTGKIVAPELYIAVGISGAIQHLAGIKDSKVIVAINKDEDAPIFQIADYGLVGDLFEIVPELTDMLQ